MSRCRGSYGKAVDIWSIGCILGELCDGQPVFPGESEIDQLYVIQKMIGPLPPEQMHLFNLNPRFRGLKFPSEIKPCTLRQKYQQSLQADLLEFLEATLRLEARKRLTIDQCADHHAFQRFRGDSTEKENSKGGSDYFTERPRKEIQFEEPEKGKREENCVEMKLGENADQSEITNGKSKQLEHRYEDTVKQGHEGKTVVIINKRESISDVTFDNGLSNDLIQKQNSDHQILGRKSSGKDHGVSRVGETRHGKESCGARPAIQKKISNDIKLDMGALTKPYGKYNKGSLNNNNQCFSKISANDMTWSVQQSNHLNPGQRSFQPKTPFTQLPNQTQVLD